MKVRELNITDVFVAARLINKVGIKKIKEKIPQEKFQELFGGTGENASAEEGESGKPATAREKGMTILLEVVPDLLDIVLEAEEDFYEFLSRLADTTPETISMLPLDETMEMINEIVSSKGFASFFTGVRRLTKME